MIPFIYNTPTKVVFEEDGVFHLEELIKEQKCKKVLIVYGGQRVIKSGFIKEIDTYLKKGGADSIALGGVVPNPLLSKVHEGIDLAISESVDFILAVGGGSVIDTAKAIGVGAASKGEVWDFYEGKREITACIPIGTILTIPAAGSEMSTSSVITHDETLLKRSMNYSGAICKFAIMDPKLTLTLPKYQTFCGVTDIMMHTLERYLNASDNLELTDSLAESLLRTVIKYAKVLLIDPNNTEARWNIMWAGSLSHNGLMNCGNNRGDWATHKIEHELGGLYDVAHGAGLAAVWATWARYVVDEIPYRFEKIGKNVFNLENENDVLSNANKAIDKMEEFFKEIDMPINLKELGVNPTEEEFKLMSTKATNNNAITIGSVKKLSSGDVLDIFYKSL